MVNYRYCYYHVRLSTKTWKAYGRRGDTAAHIVNLGTWALHFRGKEPSVPTAPKVGSVAEAVWTHWWKENLRILVFWDVTLCSMQFKLPITHRSIWKSRIFNINSVEKRKSLPLQWNKPKTLKCPAHTLIIINMFHINL